MQAAECEPGSERCTHSPAKHMNQTLSPVDAETTIMHSARTVTVAI